MFLLLISFSKRRKYVNIHNPRFLPIVFLKLFKSEVNFYSMIHNDRKNYKLYQVSLYFATKNIVEKSVCVSKSVLESMSYCIGRGIVIDNSVPIKSIKKYRSNSRENDVVIIGRFVK